MTTVESATRSPATGIAFTRDILSPRRRLGETAICVVFEVLPGEALVTAAKSNVKPSFVFECVTEGTGTADRSTATIQWRPFDGETLQIELHPYYRQNKFQNNRMHCLCFEPFPKLFT